MSDVHSKKGFSLMELLVVLVILGFMAGITAPSIGRFLDGLESKRQVGKILAAFRYARLMAVSEGKPVEVSLGEDQQILQLAGAVKETRKFDLGEDDSLELDPALIFFYPEGHVTPGTIVFNKGEKKRSFTFDPLTGLTFPTDDEDD
jgi:prepilin-type N-terminal cleavage/methylation domain-containing protein